ncbi:MAG: beta-ketoacyl-[acyl-carrier-protein] synthase family protein [Desulfobacterales bacterium]|nr:beta-ketoacyl-[acyl-carrier-protein] synthase family protein [Desulfobacterales bacterium]
MQNRVVITGMGVVSPNADSLDDFQQALQEGRSGIRYIQRLEDLNFSCRIGGMPQNFDTLVQKYFTKKQLSSLSENIGYASVAAIEAWENAGLSIPENGDQADWDTGTIFGCGICDMEIIAQKVVPVVNAGKVRRLGSRVIEQVMGSGPSARVAGILGLGNQATSNSSACSTGTEAIVEAAWRIRMGLAKRMVAGGSEGPSPYTWGGFDSMRVLSSKFNDMPEKGSRPMSATASGFVPGSGSGALILEDLTTALARDSKIYAEVLGANVNCGGQRGGGSMTAPNPDGVQRCIKSAVEDAGIAPSDIDVINGHLTATFADPHEINNWAEALDRTPGDFPYINSTKSMIGHCLGAAGAIETIASVVQLNNGFIHPSINCEDIHPELEPYADKIVQTCMDFPDLNIMAKASFGFGDVNSCLILKKWEENVSHLH